VVVDFVKLDRRLVGGAATQRSAQAVLAAVAAFAEVTGTYVIAEGVEDAAMLDFVRVVGIRGAQGYFLGRPAATVEEALAYRL
jgi:EAL domain-containing protein (putative c-di-GMP-specific phosphodiesterase class I)